MTTSTVSAAGAITDAELDERFRPVFETIAAGATAREVDRRLAFDEVHLLREAGLGALRVPVEFGGLGATVRQQFRLLIDLAAAESNLPQALRVHFSFVEDQLLAPPSAERDTWLRAVAGGVLVGNAITEPGVGAVDRYQTRLTQKDGRWVLNGTKYYSTGSLYSNYILVAADQDGERVSILVDADAVGVTQHDDWDGFGQRLTASGTTEFNNVVVAPERILGPGYGGAGKTYGTSYLQLVHLAGLSGIAQRATDDAAAWVRNRTRSYTHASADLPREDPLVQQVIGKLSAAAFTARATTLAVADVLDEVLAAGADVSPELLDRAELVSAQGQVTVIELVLGATTDLFEVGGASITAAELRLDRHWRNARTIATHNPAIFKSRAIGDYVLNGSELPYAWSAGNR